MGCYPLDRAFDRLAAFRTECHDTAAGQSIGAVLAGLCIISVKRAKRLPDLTVPVFPLDRQPFTAWHRQLNFKFERGLSFKREQRVVSNIELVGDRSALLKERKRASARPFKRMVCVFIARRPKRLATNTP